MIRATSSLKSPARGRLLAAVLLPALAVCACSGPPTAEVVLAEYLLGEDFPVSTGLILPAPAGSPAHLMDGWQELGGAPMPPEGLWVQSQRASFRFFSVAPGAPTLEFEALAMADDDARRQAVSIQLNDEQVGLQQFREGWAEYELVLPAEHMKAGWNRVDMNFRYAVRPSDQDGGSSDPRQLAATFRRLAVRSPLNRPVWPDGPQQVALSRDSGRLAIEMPTDSIFDAFVVVPPGAQLVGEVDVEMAGSGGEGVTHAVVDVLGPEGERERGFAFSATGEPASPTRVDVDLGPWAGRLVRVQLRTWGERNGIVRWLDLGIATSGDESSPSQFMSTVGEVTQSPTSGRLGRPDVVVVLLDAARADAFEDLGADTLASNVVALASEGTYFSNAWSPSSWTGQTVPSLLTGLYPDALGAETWASRVPEAFASFPDVLGDAGYHTVVWSHHTIYRGNGSLRRGFEEITHIDQTRPEARSRLPTAEELFVADRPTFALVHLLPPHGPYFPPEPFGGSLSDWYSGDFRVNARNLNRFGQEPRSPEESVEISRYARALYSENVRYADHLVGGILQMLRNESRYDDTLVMVLSDHGEAFLEHGRFLHTWGLHEEFIRVPLVVKWPHGVEGFAQEIPQHVSLVDLAPTLADGLGIGDDRARYQGQSLLPLAFKEPHGDRLVFAYTRGTATPISRPRQKWAARFGDFKLIFEPWPRGPADRMIGPPHIELYNLAHDPGERTNLTGTNEFLEGYLMQELQLFRHRNAALLSSVAGGQLTETLDPEVLHELRALGYIQ